MAIFPTLEAPVCLKHRTNKDIVGIPGGVIVHDGLNIGDLLLEERLTFKCLLQTSKSVMAVSTESGGRCVSVMGVVGVITRDGSCGSHCVLFESDDVCVGLVLSIGGSGSDVK